MAYWRADTRTGEDLLRVTALAECWAGRRSFQPQLTRL